MRKFCPRAREKVNPWRPKISRMVEISDKRYSFFSVILFSLSKSFIFLKSNNFPAGFVCISIIQGGKFRFFTKNYR